MWPPPDALWMYWAAKEAWLAGHVPDADAGAETSVPKSI